jgi:molybdopterin biosynthesis enzyme
MHWTTSNYTSVRTAYSKLTNAITIRPTAETIDVKKAVGRVLCTGMLSPIDIPSSNRSHMDGFVIKFGNISMLSPRTTIKLKLVPRRKGSISENQSLLAGKAIRVSTGEVLPRLGDTVIPLEYTQFDSKRYC